MDEKNTLQEFELEDILSEFQPADPPEEDRAEAAGEVKESAPMDTIRMNELITQLEQQRNADEAARSSPDAPAAAMDTTRMNSIIAEILEQTDGAGPAEPEATRRMDPVPEKPADAGEVPAGDTISLGSVTEAETRRLDPVAEEPTQRMEPLDPPRQEEKILYNPRTRLRDLKKKLVAGPEKRYYELSGMGIGRVQAAIFANLAIVALCILTTTLFTLDLIPENRLRFVIFSQILAMLVSAFLGVEPMVEGFLDIFRGRFSILSMLLPTFLACCADAVLCLSELRVPCCAAFSLEITMALWAQYQRHSTETAQMDSLRKAVRLNAIVREPDYHDGRAGLLRREGEVEEFMDHYNKRSGPEILQTVYCGLSLLLCIGIAVFAGMLHSVSLGVQILSTSLLVAVPASFFISLTRPAALLQRRLHMVGTVLCSWKGVKELCGKVLFPLRDEDLFPANTTKLNGVKFYGDREPDEVVAATASLIGAAGGSLETVFRKMQESRSCPTLPVDDFRDYGSGGIGGQVAGEPVLLGTLDFMQDMGVEIPEGTMVSQAIYAAIDGQLSAVFAISYAKMRSSAAGIISLCGSRKVTPVLTGSDFMITDSLLRAKFSIHTRRIFFPPQDIRSELDVWSDDPELPALALVTRDDLASYAYAVSGARALRSSCRLGMVIHLMGGILGLLIMAALAYLGTTELLTPTHVLLYQLVWMIPGLLVTEWTRTV